MEQCLRVVALLHRQRIFARLGSKKAEMRPASWPTNASVDIPRRLGDLLVELRTRQALHRRKKLPALISQLERLVSHIHESETATGELETYCIIAMLKAASDVFEYGMTLLQKLGPDYLDTLELRQMRALGYYWRICKHLADCAESHRKIFKQINILPLQPFPTDEWQGLKHCVHPVVQLLIYHEMHDRRSSLFHNYSTLR